MSLSKITYREAVKDALALEMRRDPTVVQIGEDLRGGQGGSNPALATRRSKRSVAFSVSPRACGASSGQNASSTPPSPNRPSSAWRLERR